MATALMARETMPSIDWMAVTPKSGAQLLPFSMRTGTTSIFATDGTTRLVHDGKKSFLAQPLLRAVP